MYYSTIFIFILGLSYCGIKFNINRNTKTIFYILSILSLFITAGFRYETGGDWTSYTQIFDMIAPIDKVISGHSGNFNSIPLELGYKILNSICRYICDNVQFLFFIVAGIISTFLCISIPKYSPLPILSVLIYYGILFFALDMIVIRQAIAVSIVFYSYRYIQSREKLKYMLCILFAILFHISSLFLIPIYWICHKHYSSRKLTIAFSIFLIIYFLRIQWLTGTIQFAIQIITGSDLIGKISAYTTNGTFAVQRGFSLGMIINIFLFPIFLLQRKSLEKYKYFNLFLNLFICYLFVYFCMFELVEISSRLKYYFMDSLIILLPIWVANYRTTANKILSCTLVGAFSFMYCKAQLLEQPIASAFNPYQNYIVHLITGEKSTGYERLRKSDNEFNKERGS